MPDILELALPRLAWPLDDARWHWALIQPIRGAGGNGVNPKATSRAWNCCETWSGCECDAVWCKRRCISQRDTECGRWLGAGALRSDSVGSRRAFGFA